MTESEVINVLHRMALGNPDREQVLAERKKRQSSRSRVLTCQACLRRDGYTTRGKDDVCGFCLRDMWAGADAVTKANSMMAGEGLVAVKMVAPNRPHDLPYPGLHGGYTSVPTGAVFDVVGGADSSRAMQKLFTELFVTFAEAYPASEDAQRNARVLLASSYYSSAGAYLPAKTVDVLLALWSFIIWQSNVSYEEGLSHGTNMLQQLNDGTLGEPTFMKQVADRKRQLAEAAVEAAAGNIGRRT